MMGDHRLNLFLPNQFPQESRILSAKILVLEIRFLGSGVPFGSGDRVNRQVQRTFSTLGLVSSAKDASKCRMT
jgi:hypothetical protein